MKFRLLFSLLVFIYTFGHSQTADEMNTLKYWKFRSSFREDFIKIGPLEGESFPIRQRIFAGCIDNTAVPTGEKYALLKWGDSMILHGHYLGLLATEYVLFKKNGLAVTDSSQIFDNFSYFA